MSSIHVREMLLREIKRYIREMTKIRIPLGPWLAFIVTPLMIIASFYIVYDMFLYVLKNSLPPLTEIPIVRTAAHASIIASVTLTSLILVSFILIRNRHVYWSKLFYLAISDLIKESRKETGAIEKGIMDFVTRIDQIPVEILAPYMIAMPLILILDVLEFDPLTQIFCYSIAHIDLGYVTYKLYSAIKPELAQDYDILNNMIKTFLGGETGLEELSIGVKVKTIIALSIPTLGIALYYFLKRMIDVYQAHLVIYSNTKEYLLSTLTKLENLSQ